MEMTPARVPDTEIPQTHWRNELRRRLEQHTGKGREAAPIAAPPQQERSDPPAAAAKPEIQSKPAVAAPTEPRMGESTPKLFEYQLKRPDSPRVLDNPVRPKEGSPSRRPKPVFERPIPRTQDRIAKPPLAVGATPGLPTLTLLDLKPAEADSAVTAPPAETVETPATIPAAPSREILVSRFLAGVIDLSMAGAEGALVALVASSMVSMDFFTPEGLRLAGFLGLAFQLLNSTFFLFTTGQTPGMHLTQVKLRNSTGDASPAVTSIVLRVVLFLPSVISVIGLIWAVFDSRRRCLHDRLSGTQVITAAHNRALPSGTSLFNDSVRGMALRR